MLNERRLIKYDVHLGALQQRFVLGDKRFQFFFHRVADNNRVCIPLFENGNLHPFTAVVTRNYVPVLMPSEHPTHILQADEGFPNFSYDKVGNLLRVLELV